MNMNFAQPWTCGSEYQSSTSPNRTNKSDGVAGIHFEIKALQTAGDKSVYKKGAFSVPVSVIGTHRSYIPLLSKTYSYHTLKKCHSIYPHYLKWSDCFPRHTVAKLHSNSGIKGWKSTVKWNLRAIISVTLKSSDDFVTMGTAGNKNFSGCEWRKSLTKEYIKKKKYSGTAEIKSVSFLGTFFFR